MKKLNMVIKIAISILVICLIVVFVMKKDKSNSYQNEKFNILLLMSDQHRADFMGVDGAEWMITPNLDRLAEEGIIFSNAYASVPSCFPARTSILTGMSPWQSGHLGYTPIPKYQYEMPKIFTDAGYRTHAVGKNHFTPMRNTHGLSNNCS